MDAQMARRLEEHWKGGYFRVLDPAYLPRRPIRAYVPPSSWGLVAASLALRRFVMTCSTGP
jgi:hypothetical protein